MIGFDDIAPSTVVDGGQWLIIAEQFARRVPADLGALGHDARLQAATNLERAVVALEEALKSVPPDEERIPEQVLWSREGKALYADEPGRFRRRRIEAVLAVYRNSLTQLGDNEA